MRTTFFRYTKVYRLILFGMILIPAILPAEEGIVLQDLKVEYKINPLGIDVMKPRLSWKIRSDRQNTMQTAYEIRCARSEAHLQNEENLIWKVKENSDQSIHISYKGPDLLSRQRVYWQVRIWDNHGRVSDWSKPAFWEMGLLNESDWQAKWIEAEVEEDIKVPQPAQYFRKTFKQKTEIKSARLYITSHGLYEAYLNGKRIGDQVFTPGWTSYNKQLQYQVYDVSELLLDGENVMGVTLGDGWYRGYLAWNDRRNVYGATLGLLAQLEILYTNENKEMVITDGSWRAANNGPVIMSDIYMGETYDARKELIGWRRSDFDDSAWKEVRETESPKNHLVASFGPPVRKIEEIKPVQVIPKNKGKYIIDMGQNMVGWVRLKVSAPQGTAIILRHSEVLDKQGEFYTENLRVAKQTVTYTCRGGGEEIFEPHFSFQGFRFVEITGFPGKPDLGSITGVVIHSDMTPTGNFVCSDDLINQLQHNIQWGLKGNFLDVPTDCPQRDERLGWTGDAQVFAPTACFNVDAAAFYTKWLKDLALDQGENGKVGDVIPDVLDGGGGHTGWADAAIVVPWTVYLNYGDKRVLEIQYESMKAWIGYMRDRAGENYLWQGDWHFGDWLSFDASSPAYMGAYTETDLIASAYFAYSSALMSKIAGILGNSEDAKEYRELAAKIKAAFIKEFVTPNGRLVSHTQTAYTLALAMDILPESYRKLAAENLNRNVKRFGHITTGFLGTPLISQALTAYGYLDTAYMLLKRKKYPSWLYPITMGATTIWERWDGIKPDSTFQDAGMNSFNHYAYGAIGKWLYSTVAGIEIDEENPGYKNIIFKPNPGGGLTHAKAEINTMYGLAFSSWEIKGDLIVLNILVPANTMADVYLPVKDLKTASIGGISVTESSDVKIRKDKNGEQFIKIGSGSYEFAFPRKVEEKE